MAGANGGGGRVEGFSGTTTKDTWTKPRRGVKLGKGGGDGWVGRERWEEKADNCTCTTIKFFNNGEKKRN